MVMRARGQPVLITSDQLSASLLAPSIRRGMTVALTGDLIGLVAVCGGGAVRVRPPRLDSARLGHQEVRLAESISVKGHNLHMIDVVLFSDLEVKAATSGNGLATRCHGPAGLAYGTGRTQPFEYIS